MKVRIHSARGAAITGKRLSRAADKATEATAPETTEAATAATCPIAGARGGQLVIRITDLDHRLHRQAQGRGYSPGLGSQRRISRAASRLLRSVR
jgi:hypothetical protein